MILTLLVLSCCRNDEELPPMNGGGNCPGELRTPLVIQKPGHFPSTNIPSDLTQERFELGRHLFYETRLSRNNTVSCGTCHQQERAFTDGLTKSIGLYGDTIRRNAMSISNMLWEDKFFWDARASSLEEQALMPILDHFEMDMTMPEVIERLEPDTLYQRLFCEAYGVTKYEPYMFAESIATFEMAMVSENSKYDQTFKGTATFTPQEQLGRNLFFTHPIFPTPRGGNCGDCHVQVLTSGFLGPGGMKNNGLDSNQNWTDLGYAEFTNNPNDNAKFKTTSLRNIALTGPYMHDGRFETLRDVLEHYNENVHWSPTLDPLMFASNLPNQDTLALGLLPFEVDAILAFLNTLTDTTFTNDPRFSDPFN